MQSSESAHFPTALCEVLHSLATAICVYELLEEIRPSGKILTLSHASIPEVEVIPRPLWVSCVTCYVLVIDRKNGDAGEIMPFRHTNYVLSLKYVKHVLHRNIRNTCCTEI